MGRRKLFLQTSQFPPPPSPRMHTLQLERGGGGHPVRWCSSAYMQTRQKWFITWAHSGPVITCPLGRVVKHLHMICLVMSCFLRKVRARNTLYWHICLRKSSNLSSSSLFFFLKPPLYSILQPCCTLPPPVPPIVLPMHAYTHTHTHTHTHTAVCTYCVYIFF